MNETLELKPLTDAAPVSMMLFLAAEGAGHPSYGGANGDGQ